jgi:DNA-binding CsgD family transcriptional regulator
MKGKVFIIHPSEIVSNGLQAMIRRNFNVEVEVMTSMNKTYDFRNDSPFSVYFVDIDLLQQQSNFLDTAASPTIIPVHLYMKEGITSSGEDYSLDLYCTLAQLRRVLSDVIGRNNEKEERISSKNKLTIREQEVLKMVAQGLTNKDIAEHLYISLHTVISHRKNITEKLGIKSISGLTVYAVMNNLINTDNLDINTLI